MKSKFKKYCDGVCAIYEKKKVQDLDFSSNKNAKTLDDYNLIFKSFYSYSSIREADYELYDILGKKVTEKIKIPYTTKISNNHNVLIKNIMYDVVNVDKNPTTKEVFVLLEGGREFEKSN